jgi:hypothetical protein
MAKRVFFSFHYQDVIDFRANVVRQSWVMKPNREEAGFFDASLWEQSKRTGAESLKRMIDSGLEGTSVTAVLIGSETYTRPWVQYEIFRSLERGNDQIGIHINQIPCRNRQTKLHGQNPFEHLAVKFNERGDRVDPCIWDGQKWAWYNGINGWALKNPQGQFAGQIKQLSAWHKTYCWVGHGGYQNFGSWIGE